MWMQTKLADNLNAMADQMASLAADASPEHQTAVAAGEKLFIFYCQPFTSALHINLS